MCEPICEEERQRFVEVTSLTEPIRQFTQHAASESATA